MTFQDQEAYSISDFCDAHDISRPLFYSLKAQGQAPEIMRLGRRCLITKEAAAQWRARMTAQNAQRAADELRVA
jgi:hypothetical protein